MGSSRLSEALRHLAGGLQAVAINREENSRIEGQRQFQREIQESSQQFQQRMQELQMAHGETMLTKQQDFSRSEREAGQLFDMEKFKMEQGAVNARHAQSMSAQWAQIKQSAANMQDQIKDRNLQRQLKVYEVGVTTAAGQYEKVLDAMNKEAAELAKNPMLTIDPKKMQAARQELSQRYAPQIEEAAGKVQENMDAYSSAVGIDKSGFDVSTSVDSTAQMSGDGAVNRDKVAQAVDAARAQLGGAIPNEANLISGFMKAGLTRAEAVNAARQLRSAPR